MKKALLAAPQETEVKEECRHHWVIDSPSGPTSIGTCKYCGEVKEFSNYMPFSSWDDDNSKYKKKSRNTDVKSGNVTEYS